MHLLANCKGPLAQKMQDGAQIVANPAQLRQGLLWDIRGWTHWGTIILFLAFIRAAAVRLL